MSSACRGIPPSDYRVKENIMDINTITQNKPYRVSEMQVGETIFTVISMESDLARESLYNKVKRMILDSEGKIVGSLPIPT